MISHQSVRNLFAGNSDYEATATSDPAVLIKRIRYAAKAVLKREQTYGQDVQKELKKQVKAIKEHASAITGDGDSGGISGVAENWFLYRWLTKFKAGRLSGILKRTRWGRFAVAIGRSVDIGFQLAGKAVFAWDAVKPYIPGLAVTGLLFADKIGGIIDATSGLVRRGYDATLRASRALVNNVMQPMHQLVDIVRNISFPKIKESFVKTWNSIQASLSKLGGYVVDAYNWAKDKVADVGNRIANWIGYGDWNSLVDGSTEKLLGKWNDFKSGTIGLFEKGVGLWNDAKAVIGKASDLLPDAESWLTALFNPYHTIKAMYDFVQGLLPDEVLAGISATVSSVTEGTSNLFWSAFGMLSDLWTALTDRVSSWWKTLPSWSEIGKSLLMGKGFDSIFGPDEKKEAVGVVQPKAVPLLSEPMPNTDQYMPWLDWFKQNVLDELARLTKNDKSIADLLKIGVSKNTVNTFGGFGNSSGGNAGGVGTGGDTGGGLPAPSANDVVSASHDSGQQSSPVPGASTGTVSTGTPSTKEPVAPTPTPDQEFPRRNPPKVAQKPEQDFPRKNPQTSTAAVSTSQRAPQSLPEERYAPRTQPDARKNPASSASSVASAERRSKSEQDFPRKVSGSIKAASVPATKEPAAKQEHTSALDEATKRQAENKKAASASAAASAVKTKELKKLSQQMAGQKSVPPALQSAPKSVVPKPRRKPKMAGKQAEDMLGGGGSNPAPASGNSSGKDTASPSNFSSNRKAKNVVGDIKQAMAGMGSGVADGLGKMQDGLQQMHAITRKGGKLGKGMQGMLSQALGGSQIGAVIGQNFDVTNITNNISSMVSPVTSMMNQVQGMMGGNIGDLGNMLQKGMTGAIDEGEIQLMRYVHNPLVG